MIVYTGYFTKTNKYTEAGLTPISIAGRKPEGIDVEEWKFLAPSYDIFMSWKKTNLFDKIRYNIFLDEYGYCHLEWNGIFINDLNCSDLYVLRCVTAFSFATS